MAGANSDPAIITRPDEAQIRTSDASRRRLFNLLSNFDVVFLGVHFGFEGFLGIETRRATFIFAEILGSRTQRIIRLYSIIILVQKPFRALACICQRKKE
jgi:hypothetical protein